MRSSASRFPSAIAALVAAAALGVSSRAAAQACCAGTAAITPARLGTYEDALVGVQTRALNLVGSFDAGRRVVGAPADTADLELAQDLFVAARVLSRGQVSVIFPFVATWRKASGLSEAGGGVGDLQLGARWDFTLPGASVTVPGIAVSAGALFPTGKPPESASNLLATDATGAGALQLSLGLALEQTFGPWLINLTGTAAWRGPRAVFDMTAQQGAQASVFVAGGYTFKNGAVLALTASYTAELEAVIEGARVPDSGRAGTRLGVAGGYSLSHAWRMQGSFFGDVPIPYLGYNQPIGVGLSLLLARSWS